MCSNKFRDALCLSCSITRDGATERLPWRCRAARAAQRRAVRGVTRRGLERRRGGRPALALRSVVNAGRLGCASAAAGGGRCLAALAGAHRAARGGQAAVGPEQRPSRQLEAGSHFSAAPIPRPPPGQGLRGARISPRRATSVTHARP